MIKVQLNSEFKLTAPGELAIHAFMESENENEERVKENYKLIDDAVDKYLQQLNSECKYDV